MTKCLWNIHFLDSKCTVSEHVYNINSLTTTRLIVNSKLHIESKWQEARMMESEFQLPPTFSEMWLNASHITFNKSKKIVNESNRFTHLVGQQSFNFFLFLLYYLASLSSAGAKGWLVVLKHLFFLGTRNKSTKRLLHKTIWQRPKSEIE